MISDASLTQRACLTGVPRPANVTTWIAVDANPHRVRAVLVAKSRILGSFQASTGPRQAARTLNFLRATIPADANVRLAGRLYDRWPSQLHAALVMEFGPVTWINPTLLTTTLPDVNRWGALFKTYRALFFAICAEQGAERELSPFCDRFDVLCAWKNAVLDDLNVNYTQT